MTKLSALLALFAFSCSERTVYIDRISQRDLPSCGDASVGDAAVDAAPDGAAVVDASPDAASACAANNGGAGCTTTEALIANQSIDCYNCLVLFGCVDDVIYGDQGLECEDVPGVAVAGALAGQTRASLCLQVLMCAMATGCAHTDAAHCYCGSLDNNGSCASSSNPAAANGPCAPIELAAIEHPANEAPVSLVGDFFNTLLGGGRANMILSCSAASCSSVCSF